MAPREVNNKYKHKKNKLLNPVTDDQQTKIDEQIDTACRSHFNLDPTDPRVIPYLLPALWLWK